MLECTNHSYMLSALELFASTMVAFAIVAVATAGIRRLRARRQG